jgi:hypothetical protein
VVASFEEIIIFGPSETQGWHSLPWKARYWLGTMGLRVSNRRLTTYLHSNPDPPRASKAAKRGVAKRARARAMSIVIEVHILKVKVGTDQQLKATRGRNKRTKTRSQSLLVRIDGERRLVV